MHGEIGEGEQYRFGTRDQSSKAPRHIATLMRPLQHKTVANRSFDEGYKLSETNHVMYLSNARVVSRSLSALGAIGASINKQG